MLNPWKLRNFNTYSTMKYLFNTDYLCAANHIADPATVRLIVDESLLAKIPVIAEPLKANGVTYAYLKWVAECTFFDKNGNLIAYPDYDSCCMRVFPDASFRFIFPYSHTKEEGFTDILEISDAVEVASA